MSQFASTDAWRVAVRDAPQGPVRGGGFVIAPDVVLSCARVVRDEPVWLTSLACPGVPALTEPPELRAGWQQARPSEDLAVLRTPAGFAPVAARLGPRERPAPGTEVVSPGPEPAVAVVTGTDGSGELLALRPAAGSPPVPRAHSGSAVVDRVTGHVVGMVTWVAGEDGPPGAWVIPVDVIAAHVAGLGESLAPASAGDHRSAAAHRALARRDYDEAAYRFLLLAREYGDASLHHYAALAALQGTAPGAHSDQTVAHVEALLEAALERDGDCVPAVALWALVKEDAFRMRGRPVGSPSIELLSSRIGRIDPRAAAEILFHVDAPGTGTSRLLRRAAEEVRP